MENKRNWIETPDGRLLDQSMFSAYNLVQRRNDGDLEIVGYRHAQKKKGCNLATFQNPIHARRAFEKFKDWICDGDALIKMQEIKDKTEPAV